MRTLFSGSAGVCDEAIMQRPPPSLFKIGPGICLCANNREQSHNPSELAAADSKHREARELTLPP